jgi:Domain of unknown function (DUF4145)
MRAFQEGERARAGETIVPAFKKGAFHCWACAVFSPQTWSQMNDGHTSTPMWRCECDNCQLPSYWINPGRADLPATMVYPLRGAAPNPHPDMPDDVRREYVEASATLAVSPRGAGALLRLAVQKLMPHIGESGTNLNDDIASLVRKGLDPDVQKALDALRVVGNNAVHPLELDLQDDAETVGALFGILNFIVEERIVRPRKLDSLYKGLPEGARRAIDARDSPREIEAS